MCPWVQGVHAFIRPAILLLLTLPTMVLALRGHEGATEVLLIAFIAAVAFYFGERAGLATPAPPPPQ